jgi:hypothetical protein
LPLTTTVVAGNTADDPLYLPEIAKIRQSAGSRGLTYVGDCKMAALGYTRCDCGLRGLLLVTALGQTDAGSGPRPRLERRA